MIGVIGAILFYRDYRGYIDADFKNDLKFTLLANKNTYVNFNKFQDIFRTVLDRYAPIKQKYLRANEVPYMTKKLRKAIMTRSRLQNRFYKTNSVEDKENFKKHKNYCNRLYKKERKQYYNNMNLKNITENNLFWKTVKPFLTDKGTRINNITLIEKGEIISNDVEVADTLNKFFKDTVSSLEIREPTEYLNDNTNENDFIDSILVKYANHPSIKMIKERVNVPGFTFTETSLAVIETEIYNLNAKKSNPENSISAQNLKDHIEICGTYLYEIINHSLINSNFDDGMKIADITPVHKKDDVTNKSNCRPISGLPSGSKLFERIIQKQIAIYIETCLHPYLCAYRKGYNVQHALIALIEKWRVSLDNKSFGGAILMDLSKAFDTINHDLLIAKLYAYGFNKMH